MLYFAGTLRPLRVYFFLSRTMRGRNWGVLTCLAIGFFRFGIDPPPCLGRAQHGEQPWPLEFGHGVVIVDPASARLGQTDDALGDGPASGALADVGQLEPAPAAFITRLRSYVLMNRCRMGQHRLLKIDRYAVNYSKLGSGYGGRHRYTACT